MGAYGGRKDIMEMVAPAGPMYQAGTLSGNPLAMTAGIKVRGAGRVCIQLLCRTVQSSLIVAPQGMYRDVLLEPSRHRCSGWLWLVLGSLSLYRCMYVEPGTDPSLHWPFLVSPLGWAGLVPV